VLDGSKLRGIVAEGDLLRHLVSRQGTLDSSIEGLIESDYASVSPDTKIELLQQVLAEAKVVLVIERDNLVGLITKIDLVDFLAKRTIIPKK
jgi:cystathionine beta-synthase